jgi:hypothetical protein
MLAGADRSVDFRRRVLEAKNGKIGKTGDGGAISRFDLGKRFRLLQTKESDVVH